MPKNPDVRITTTVVAYTSFCDGQVTRFSSLRTSERKSRIRSKRPPAASLTVSNRPASSAIHQFTNSPIPPFTNLTWQARRESNPQPPVLETGALPIELLAYPIANCQVLIADLPLIAKIFNKSAISNWHSATYLLSLCAVCFRQKRQNFKNSSRSVVFFLFFVVL